MRSTPSVTGNPLPFSQTPTTSTTSGEHTDKLRRRRSPNGEREAPPPVPAMAAPKGAVSFIRLLDGAAGSLHAD